MDTKFKLVGSLLLHNPGLPNVEKKVNTTVYHRSSDEEINSPPQS